MNDYDTEQHEAGMNGRNARVAVRGKWGFELESERAFDSP